MSISLDLDLTDSSEYELDTKFQKNLHVVKCCGNCKFFLYHKTQYRTGFCGWGLPKTSVKKKSGSYTKFPHAHVTCLCDNHIVRRPNVIHNTLSNWLKERNYEPLDIGDTEIFKKEEDTGLLQQ